VKASPRGLLDYSHFDVPGAVLDETVALLDAAGSKGDERMVAWGAVRHPEGGLNCPTLYVPAQTAIRTTSGVGIFIAAEALRELNLQLSRRGEILAVQVHAHPTDAYHSTADDTLAIATTLGALSIVVPDFAAGGVSAINSWAGYRLDRDGWHEIELAAILGVR
jgi:hypothetical protein